MTLNIIRKTQIHTQSEKIKHNKIPNSLNTLIGKTGQRNFTKTKKSNQLINIFCVLFGICFFWLLNKVTATLGTFNFSVKNTKKYFR